MSMMSRVLLSNPSTNLHLINWFSVPLTNYVFSLLHITSPTFNGCHTHFLFYVFQSAPAWLTTYSTLPLSAHPHKNSIIYLCTAYRTDGNIEKSPADSPPPSSRQIIAASAFVPQHLCRSYFRFITHCISSGRIGCKDCFSLLVKHEIRNWKFKA